MRTKALLKLKMTEWLVPFLVTHITQSSYVNSWAASPAGCVILYNIWLLMYITASMAKCARGEFSWFSWVFIVFHSIANLILWIVALWIGNISLQKCNNKIFIVNSFSHWKHESFPSQMFCHIQYSSALMWWINKLKCKIGSYMNFNLVNACIWTISS